MKLISEKLGESV